MPNLEDPGEGDEYPEWYLDRAERREQEMWERIGQEEQELIREKKRRGHR